MDFVLPDCMLHIAGFLDVAPGAAELMQLDCNLPEVLQVKGLYHTDLYAGLISFLI